MGHAADANALVTAAGYLEESAAAVLNTGNTMGFGQVLETLRHSSPIEKSTAAQKRFDTPRGEAHEGSAVPDQSKPRSDARVPGQDGGLARILVDSYQYWHLIASY